MLAAMLNVVANVVGWPNGGGNFQGSSDDVITAVLVSFLTVLFDVSDVIAWCRFNTFEKCHF